MDKLSSNQVGLVVHGPDRLSDAVLGTVFASKLSALVRALKAADKVVNGEPVHDYFIAKLHTSTPTAILNELPIRGQYDLRHHNSGIAGFRSCVDAIVYGDRDRALSFSRCTEQVKKFAGGAPNKFGYAEVWPNNNDPIRIDSYLKERAATMLTEPLTILSQGNIGEKTERWFSGVSQGSFDGTIKAVDLRGALPEVVLILSAGHKEIQCVCRAADIPVIGRYIDQRVRVSGRATYDGGSGLPRRLEVSSIDPVPKGGDFSRWKGAFEPFEIKEWEDQVS